MVIPGATIINLGRWIIDEWKKKKGKNEVENQEIDRAEKLILTIRMFLKTNSLMKILSFLSLSQRIIKLR